MTESPGNRLKRAFKELGITQEEVAEGLGIKQASISGSLSSGKVSQELAQYIGIAYNINLNWVYLNKGDMILKGSGESVNQDELKEMALSLARAYKKIEKLEGDLSKNQKKG